MRLTECCKNCNHCNWPNTSSYGWCRLRKIKVHSEIAQFAFCHHWSSKEPILPNLREKEFNLDTQLDFDPLFQD